MSIPTVQSFNPIAYMDTFDNIFSDGSPTTLTKIPTPTPTPPTNPTPATTTTTSPSPTSTSFPDNLSIPNYVLISIFGSMSFILLLVAMCGLYELIKTRCIKRPRPGGISTRPPFRTGHFRTRALDEESDGSGRFGANVNDGIALNIMNIYGNPPSIARPDSVIVHHDPNHDQNAQALAADLEATWPGEVQDERREREAMWAERRRVREERREEIEARWEVDRVFEMENGDPLPLYEEGRLPDYEEAMLPDYHQGDVVGVEGGEGLPTYPPPAYGVGVAL